MATTQDLEFDQGADVAVELHLKDADGNTKDLSNYSVAAKIKKSYNSDSDDTTDFTAIISTPATDGVVTLSLTNSQTDALTARRYVYDVELSYVDSDANTIIERILEGRVFMKPSVTK